MEPPAAPWLPQDTVVAAVLLGCLAALDWAVTCPELHYKPEVVLPAERFTGMRKIYVKNTTYLLSVISKIGLRLELHQVDMFLLAAEEKFLKLFFQICFSLCHSKQRILHASPDHKPIISFSPSLSST